MEAALEKIRPHTSSGLLHQKKPADLLFALESTFDEQKTERSPTAYFAALLTTLEGTVQKQDLGLDDGDVLPAELYLLALVSPFVPPPVIRSHLSTVLTIAGPLFSILTTHAPPLRSEMTLFENVILALERSQLDAHGVRQIFASILQLSLDSRPKVRRKAAEVIKNILNSPPPPLMYHPYAKIVADWAIEALAISNTGAIPRAKGKKADASFSDTFLHLLSCIRPILSKFPAEALPSMTTSLLSLPRLGNPFLSQLAYSLLADLFESASSSAEETNLPTQIPAVLHAVLSFPPSKSDPTLPSSWVHLLGVTMLAYHSYDTSACAAELPKVWKAVWNWMESPDLAIRSTTATSLGLLIKCIPPPLVEVAIQESSASDEPKVLVNRIVKQLTGAIDAINYARAIPQVFEVISLLITHLQKDASEKLLGSTIQKIALLRVNKSFEHKESADATLSIAMRVLGPRILLRYVPLNLEPSDRAAGREPHAFLLPMLAQPHPSPLSHFLEYFVPLSERMFELEQKAEAEGKASEAKVWNVLIDQVWSGFVGYCWCHGTPKLQNDLTPAFSQLLSQILYSQPELRPTVLKALKVLVESNVSIASSATQNTDVDTITREEAAANVAFLRTQSESWLSVLFNVFSNMDRNSRNLVGDVITPWASIAGEQEIVNAYRKVVGLFKSHLRSAAPQRGPAEAGSPASTMQDIILLLLPYLGTTDAHELFKACLSREVLASEDSGVQKRGYKILGKLLESGKVDDIDTEAVIKELDSMIDSLSAAAKKDRVLVLTRLIPKLPPTMLHMIPTLIPEAVLGTKEPSEKARSAAFDLIVIMGCKMGDGGVVKRNLLDGMDEDEASESPAEVSASVEEYFTMIAGGLVGATPHMISATITAISRLLFEFKDRISENMQKEILTTLLVFVNSNNREIVKSALGFVKLAIHTLSVALLTPFLKDIVPSLLSWSHNHNNHFKVKVRHILERMIRRFGFEAVYQCAGEDEAGKVLLNIKKRKDRMKRKKAQQEEDNEDDDEHEAKPKVGDAFEDVLYGSESELEDSDEEGEQNQKSAGKNNKKTSGGKFGARLRIDDEEPMDLLHGAASHITNAQTKKRRKPGQDAAHFKTDEDTGKMIIDEKDSESDDDDHAGAQKDAGASIAGAAYHEAQISVDGFVRGQSGHVKFHRDTKKRRREELENAIEDVEMADGEGAGKKKMPKKRQDAKLGHDFKAKKAGGDVKKGGVDPYAYLSLSAAAKKGRGRLGVASKK